MTPAISPTSALMQIQLLSILNGYNTACENWEMSLPIISTRRRKKTPSKRGRMYKILSISRLIIYNEPPDRWLTPSILSKFWGSMAGRHTMMHLEFGRLFNHYQNWQTCINCGWGTTLEAGEYLLDGSLKVHWSNSARETSWEYLRNRCAGEDEKVLHGGWASATRTQWSLLGLVGILRYLGTLLQHLIGRNRVNYHHETDKFMPATSFQIAQICM